MLEGPGIYIYTILLYLYRSIQLDITASFVILWQHQPPSARPPVARARANWAAASGHDIAGAPRRAARRSPPWPRSPRTWGEELTASRGVRFVFSVFAFHRCFPACSPLLFVCSPVFPVAFPRVCFSRAWSAFLFFQGENVWPVLLLRFFRLGNRCGTPASHTVSGAK